MICWRTGYGSKKKEKLKYNTIVLPCTIWKMGLQLTTMGKATWDTSLKRGIGKIRNLVLDLLRWNAYWNSMRDREKGVGMVSVEFKKEIRSWGLIMESIRIEILFNLWDYLKLLKAM